jgi:hypothetical protein
MADAQPTRTASSTDTKTSTGDTVGSVNVYDHNSADTMTPPVERQTTYSPPPAPATRSASSFITWLIVLALVVLALYFVVQFLT